MLQPLPSGNFLSREFSTATMLRSLTHGRRKRLNRRAQQRSSTQYLVEKLEDRTLLSSAAMMGVIQSEVAPGVFMERWTVDAADAPRVPQIERGGSLGDEFPSLPEQLNGNGLQFNLIPASGMPQFAIDGFQAAANLWSSILTDDIIVNINIDYRALGTGILGQASSTTESMSVSVFRNSLTADATSLSDVTAVANLPTSNSLSLYTSNPSTGRPEIDNNGSANNNVMDINTANSKALGVRAAGETTIDASIAFSSGFTWDFDRSDGITFNAFDFVGVAAHEIGHALGFRSGADLVDLTSGAGPWAPDDLNNYRVVTSLDVFRFSTGSIANGTDLDLRADTAPKFFSIDGGATQIAQFATGQFNGDGSQASHWKDNLGLGLFDPTIANGEYGDITALDVLALDVIGWDIVHDFGDAPDTGAGTGSGNYATLLQNNGPRHMLFSASGLITDPTGAPKVYLGAGVDWDFDGQPNSTATGDSDNGISAIPALNPGSTAYFDVVSTAGGAHLDYFFDFNQNGSFDDPGESFSVVLTSTTQSVPVVVPSAALPGTTFARFRISSDGGLGPTGPAADGEVEDYQVTVNAGTPVYVVDTLVDENDGNYSAGDFSLREAIFLANLNPGPAIIQFSPALSGGVISLTLGALPILDDLRIEGPGAGLLTISAAGVTGGGLSRIFDLQSSPDVEIDGLTITNGRTTAIGQGGGAIRSTGNLLLKNSVVQNSSTTGSNSEGGAILQINGSLTIENTMFSNNSTTGAGAYGGAISSLGGVVLITNSTFTGNSTASSFGAGGGVLVRGADLTIADSTIANNSNTGIGSIAGGVGAVNGNLTISGSTIVGNQTTGPAGGIAYDSNGGPVSAVIRNSTISGNTAATGYGGGITTFNGTLNLQHSTVTMNSAPNGSGSGLASHTDGGTNVANTVVLSSIIAGNTNSDVDNVDFSGNGANTITSSGFNLIGTGNAGSSFNQTADQVGVLNPVLGSLADNGGPTWTHALLAGSPAIGAGDTSSALVTDQRGSGFPRLVGGRVDIGAFELAATNPLVSLSVDNPNIPEASGIATFTATLSQVTGEDVTVNLSFSGTATLGSDYTISGTQIVIPAGSLTGFITVTALQDAVAEPDETVIVDISGVLNGTEDGIQQATTTIIDDDMSALTVQIVASAISEGAGPGATTVIITRNTDPGEAMTVHLSSSNPTKAIIQPTVVIPAGQTSVIVNLDAVDNDIVDGTVTVTITASTITQASSATVDTTFGTNGVVVTSLSNSLSPIRFDMELQPDGKILAIGQHPTITNTWRVIRLNPNGSYDSTFGTGGIVDTAFPGSSSGRPMAIEQLSDGRILVIGAGYSTINAPVMARYTSSGALDPTFGTNGIVILPNTYRVTTDAVVNPDGSIWTAGWSSGDNSQGFPLVLINVDGSVGTTTWTNVGANVLDYEAADQIVRQADGKIIVAGRATSGVFTTRFNSDGTIDTQYGNNGVSPVIAHPANRTFQVTDIKLDSQGRVVITGATIVQAIGTRDSSFVARFNTNGTLDSTFSTNGVWVSTPGTQTTFYDLELLPDGRMLLLGSVFVSGLGTERSIHRLNPNGGLDTTFGSNGIQLLPSLPSTWEEIFSGVLQPDGKLSTYSERFANFRIERFHVFTPGITGSDTVHVMDDDYWPLVTGEVINGGDVNRSGIRSLQLQFDAPVTLAGAADLNLYNHTTQQWVDISVAVLSGNGTSSLTWDLSSILLPNGIYTAELPADRPLFGRLAATHVVQFHVLRGDVSGNLQVDFADIGLVLTNFNTIGGLRYGPGDVDGNGDVDFADIGLLLSNFNQIYSAPTFDFGDAAQGYPVLLADNGARHLLGSGLMLGSTVDGELDGTESSGADADHDDGVQFGVLTAGAIGTLTVHAVVPAGMQVYLNGWFDLNQDGDWQDPGEQLIQNFPVTNGINILSVLLPFETVPGSTMVRMRLSSSMDISYFGLARDGEVEDYLVTIEAPPPQISMLAVADTGDFVWPSFGMPEFANGRADVFGTSGLDIQGILPIGPGNKRAEVADSTAASETGNLRNGGQSLNSKHATTAPAHQAGQKTKLISPLRTLDEGLLDLVFAEDLGI